MNIRNKIYTAIISSVFIIVIVICILFNVSGPRTVTIENNAVKTYMDKVTYKEGDESVVKEYIPEGDERCDFPEEYVVHFTPTDGNVRLIIAGEEDRNHPADSRIITASGSAGEIMIDNLYPDNDYAFRVQYNGQDYKTGNFKTTGRVRMIHVDGIYNVRDIGGWGAQEGKKIKYGKIYRGSEMNGEHEIRITPEGRDVLVNLLGIGCDLDLRLDSEVDMSDDKDNVDVNNLITVSALGPDIMYKRISIEAYVKPWIGIKENGAGKEGTELYCAAFQTIFDSVESGIPIYIHCWGGADRTGTVCLLLEGLLGVSESDLAKEYELTSFAKKFNSRTCDSDDYRGMMEYIKSMNGETLQENFERFFLEMGFTKEAIESFREEMLS